MKRVTLLLADEEALLRDGLAALLAIDPRFDIVGSTGDGRELVRQALRGQPDLIVFDCAMRGLSGLEAARRIAPRCPETRMLCLSSYEDSRWIRAAFDAGAHGYLLKRTDFDVFVSAVDAVLQARYVVSPELEHLVSLDQRHRHVELEPEATLSAREREITQLYAEGHSTKDIAERLHVSIKTVGTHREHIMAKLGIQGLAQLTRYALREGITILDS
ncbi:MAG: Oxygen regulatory protein NreC [Luteibacter sp.]|uniref:response regulator n=1 Tax=Luteibacter sp. TaxID=1886636 RepID=UPI00138321D6|nr:response regulator transcription factor [Luteibacter sp.]KAF1008865.1 MAG: Oxygen regulatory protein NreC [Luteibacter sp.]